MTTTTEPAAEDVTAEAWHLVADLAAVAGDRDKVCAVLAAALTEDATNLREAAALLATVVEFTYADCLTEPVTPYPRGKKP